MALTPVRLGNTALPQDKLSLLWMGMGMAAVRKNDSQNNHDGVA